jgi:hypothetical protein
MKNKVAFIMTVYKNDKLKFFKEAIESIVNQDYGFENINIYLGIDGNIPLEIETYINENRNFFYKIVKNKQNKGLAFILNRLIDILENEEYIFRMDSDDICKRDRVSKQVNFMELHPQIEIIGGAIEEIDESGNVKMIRTYPKSTIEAKDYIVKASIFAHPTVCFRKSFFEKGFRYNENYKFNQDLALWFESLSKNIQISNIDDVVLSLRISDDFYKRRNYKRAFSEFQIYWKGIIKLYGYNWRLIYPIVRLIIRLMPSNIIKVIYSEKFRKFLNK